MYEKRRDKSTVRNNYITIDLTFYHLLKIYVNVIN